MTQPRHTKTSLNNLRWYIKEQAHSVKYPTAPNPSLLLFFVSVFCCVSLCLCVLCLCVLCAVSLCSVRSVGPLNRTSLHSPTQGAGGRETLVFNFSRVCPQCVIARSRPSTRRRACRVDQLVLVQSRRVQDATQCIVSRMVQHAEVYNQSLHQLTFVMK